MSSSSPKNNEDTTAPEKIETRRCILESTRTLLTRQHYSATTMRTIAADCGISVGNLTYHFANRSLLMQEVVADTVEHYLGEASRIMNRKESSSGDSIRELMKWFIIETADRDVSRFFRNIWQLATEDSSIALKLSEGYRSWLDMLKVQIREAYPNCSDFDLEHSAIMFGTTMEGTNALFGVNTRRPLDLEEHASYVAEVFFSHLKSRNL